MATALDQVQAPTMKSMALRGERKRKLRYVAPTNRRKCERDCHLLAGSTCQHNQQAPHLVCTDEACNRYLAQIQHGRALAVHDRPVCQTQKGKNKGRNKCTIDTARRNHVPREAPFNKANNRLPFSVCFAFWLSFCVQSSH